MAIDRVMVIHPGADWAVSDVFSGMVDGLVANGVKVYPFQFARRLVVVSQALEYAWLARGDNDADRGPKPTLADAACWVSEQSVTWALRHLPVGSWIIVVSGMYFHPDAYAMFKKAGYRVAMLLTESPYEVDKEIQYAAMVDKVWSNESCTIDVLKTGNPTTTYLPHAYNPFVHHRMPEAALADSTAPAHDVLFVGTGFKDRIEFFESIDWTGIDLGIYGSWDYVDEDSPIQKYVHRGMLPNGRVALMYQRAKINLNVFRWTKGWAGVDRVDRADSLNPRLYELAAMGCFTLSQHRPEVTNLFGTDIPTFGSSAELEALLRRYLADDGARQVMAARLPAHVAQHTWVHRAAQMLEELEAM